jgi:hypothetical protein
MKKYQCNITFFYEAYDDNDALGTADGIAGYIEETYEPQNEKGGWIKIEARVGGIEQIKI